jgi:hypothetical protein
VIGWFSANPSIHPGIVSTVHIGTRYKCQRENQKGEALRGLSISGQRAERHEEPFDRKSERNQQRKRRQSVSNGAWIRKPTAKQTADLTTSPHTNSAVSASALPPRIVLLGMGRERSRSTSPCSRSSATPITVFVVLFTEVR